LRIAILDLGTNTFHLLVTSVNKNGVWKKVFKSKSVVKLGEGAIHKNEIAPVPFRRGIKALEHYKKIIDIHMPEKVFAFATSAIRGATNGHEFVAVAKEKTGIDITVISGEKEAELIYLGVRQCISLDDQPVLIMDIGGGSTEFIIADKDKIFWKHSFNIGAARLLEMFRPSDPILPAEISSIETFLSNELAIMVEAVEKFKPEHLIGSSGSFDTFAEMIGYEFHNRNVISDKNSYRFKIDEYLKLHEKILYSTAMQRNQMKGLVKMRIDMIVMATICTSMVLNKTGIKKMTLSKYALKEGALSMVISGKV
jgi:exopolyphosphatase/guanosine-5'-triphosphate,3'-diphosphate pyrophosphatase